MWYRHPERATFVQIGANDGITNDPLYGALGLERLESRWIGLQVEPAPMLFGNVTTLHRNASGWSFYNGAMANSTLCRNGVVTFLESTGFKGQLSTLNEKSEHRGVLTPKNRSCMASFDELLGRYASPAFIRSTYFQSVYHVDLLVIDVEGFDDKVIALIDWDTLSPHCIFFEIIHINATNVLSLLKRKGYAIHADAFDALACRVVSGATLK